MGCVVVLIPLSPFVLFGLLYLQSLLDLHSIIGGERGQDNGYTGGAERYKMWASSTSS